MSDFHLLIMGADLAPRASLQLDCDDAAEAMEIALSVISPYGHALFEGDEFMARFDRAWSAHLEPEPEPN
jgi:hypothetical protein